MLRNTELIALTVASAAGLELRCFEHIIVNLVGYHLAFSDILWHQEIILIKNTAL